MISSFDKYPPEPEGRSELTFSTPFDERERWVWMMVDVERSVERMEGEWKARLSIDVQSFLFTCDVVPLSTTALTKSPKRITVP